MASTSLKPIAAKRFGYLEAQHLLNRAAFGGTPTQVQALVSMGPAKAVDYLVDYEKVDDAYLPSPDADADIWAPPSKEEQELRRKAYRENKEEARAKVQAIRQQKQGQDRRQLAKLQQWWVDRMIATPRPLQEKLTLLWHNHFAVNYRGCEDSYLLLQQNEMFRDHAHGSFADLARGIVRDPAMLVFLNNDQNNKRKPNENLARELMELFTLGVGNYTEQDIKQGARALTGYTRRDNDFHFNKGQHDPGTKTILGKTGKFNGDDFAELCLAHKACPRFVAYKLYKEFVADVPKLQHVAGEQKRMIGRLGYMVRHHKYRLKPVLKTVFRSEHFYDDAVRGSKIKSPVELTVGLVRTLNTPQRSGRLLTDAMRMMGQEVFNPPNVAGWPGGKSWVNTSTMFIRQNLATYLITGKPPFNSGWSRKQMNYDATALIGDLDKPTADAVVGRLSDVLLGSAATSQRRTQLRQFLKDHNDRVTNDTLIALLCLITAMPEYQLC